MKKRTILLTAVCLLGISGISSAQAEKIGFVDATKVVEHSPQYAAARKALETEFTRRDKDLVGKQKQLKQLEEKLVRDSAVMSTSELKRLEQDIRSRRRALNHAKDEFREDFNLRRNEEFNKLRRQVAEVVIEVGKNNNLDIILSEGVIYASERVDISKKVLERLEQSFKAKSE